MVRKPGSRSSKASLSDGGPLAGLIRLLSSDRFIVCGESMRPALCDGHAVLVDRKAYHRSSPARADIVLLRGPAMGGRGGEVEYIKRVVALPGEQVNVRGGRVFVDGGLLEEAHNAAPSAPRLDRDGQWLLGPEEYFILGDNRADSFDSRAFGPAPQAWVQGRVWFRYWPPRAWGRVR